MKFSYRGIIPFQKHIEEFSAAPTGLGKHIGSLQHSDAINSASELPG